MQSKATMSPHKEATQTLASKWGKDLVEAGWTALPNVIFKNQNELGLKPLDVLILLHLASYWRTASEPPRPAKGTIAACINVDPRTVQRSIKKMEDLNYLRRIVRKGTENSNLPNEYDLTGLIRATKVNELARDEIDYRKAQALEKAKRNSLERARRESPDAFALEQKLAQ
jgi:hypothetical protein